MLCTVRSFALPLVLLGILPVGCSSLECGPNTSEKVDPTSGKSQCVPAANAGETMPIPCNADAGAHIVGGVCVGDPNQFPKCGNNTMLDPISHTCVPTGGGTPTPKPCPKPAGNNICLNGVVRYLKDFAFTKGKPLEVRAYDPFEFLGNPQTMPLGKTTTDADGTYILELVPRPQLGTIAVAVTDPGGPSMFVLSGSGAQGLSAGNGYQVDLFAVDNALVASWDQQLGFAGMDTFEAHGAYIGVFVNGQETTSPPVADVVMTFKGMQASDQYFFKGDRATIDKAATKTDALTGSAVQRVDGVLDTYSGMGGGVANWESGPGTSVAGVVFVQVFHPVM